VVVVGQCVDARTETAGKAHLGQRNGKAALAEVVARHHEAGLHGGMEVAIVRWRVRIGCWRNTWLRGFTEDFVEV
jgi:hypothetical protein